MSLWYVQVCVVAFKVQILNFMSGFGISGDSRPTDGDLSWENRLSLPDAKM